jgi:hypothetical protein
LTEGRKEERASTRRTYVSPVKVNNRKKTKGISWEGRIEIVIELYTLWGFGKSGPPAISDHVPDRGRQDDGQGWTRWTSPVVMGIELCKSTIMVVGTGLPKKKLKYNQDPKTPFAENILINLRPSSPSGSQAYSNRCPTFYCSPLHLCT